QVYTSINYGYRKSNLYDVSGLVQKGITLPPNAPDLLDRAGNINWELDEFGNLTFVNPMAGFNNPNTMRMQSLQWNGTLRYSLLKGFIAKLNIGFHTMDQGDKQINYAASFNPTFPERIRRTTTTQRLSSRENVLLEPQVQYSFTKDNHQF